jgi:hypothetical protein
MADMTMRRGTLIDWTVTMDDDGSSLTFTGATINFAVRQWTPDTTETTDALALIAKDSDTGGITIVDGPNRICVLEIVEADTKALQPGIYKADFKWIPMGESDARSMGDLLSFEITEDEVRAI